MKIDENCIRIPVHCFFLNSELDIYHSHHTCQENSERGHTPPDFFRKFLRSAKQKQPNWWV